MSVRTACAFVAASACFGFGAANASEKVIVSAKDASKVSSSSQSKSGDRDSKGDHFGKNDKDKDFPRPSNPRPPSRR